MEIANNSASHHMDPRTLPESQNLEALSNLPFPRLPIPQNRRNNNACIFCQLSRTGVSTSLTYLIIRDVADAVHLVHSRYGRRAETLQEVLQSRKVSARVQTSYEARGPCLCSIGMFPFPLDKLSLTVNK
jgi:hypothetical protein